jgi:adenosylcobinamide-GDP ribazoletransferase
MLRAFEVSLAFLTVLRIRVEPPADLEEVGRCSWAFPLAGAAIGAALAAVWWLIDGNFPASVSAVLIVGLWAVLSGGLHMDGWTDCWDALAATVPPQRRHEILKDPRLGTFGALGLFLLVAAKASALVGPAGAAGVLIIAPMVGRASMVLAAGNARHSGDGMAAAFITGVETATTTRAALIGFAPTVLLGWRGILAAAAAWLAMLWFRRFAEARLGGVNGDVLGAVCELSEAVFLIVICMRM